MSEAATIQNEHLPKVQAAFIGTETLIGEIGTRAGATWSSFVYLKGPFMDMLKCEKTRLISLAIIGAINEAESHAAKLDTFSKDTHIAGLEDKCKTGLLNDPTLKESLLATTQLPTARSFYIAYKTFDGILAATRSVLQIADEYHEFVDEDGRLN